MALKQTFDTETIRLITLFENITKAPVRDCMVDEKVVCFIVEEGKLGVAIGRNGGSVKNAERIIGKSIKLFEFSNDLMEFVKKAIPHVSEVMVRNEHDRTIVEIKVEKKNRALVIGRDGKNLKFYKELLQRNYSVNDLLVR